MTFKSPFEKKEVKLFFCVIIWLIDMAFNGVESSSRLFFYFLCTFRLNEVDKYIDYSPVFLP